ncbi:hypothetical protein KQI89_03030 [Clostridium sp. MSJ-4]|uniref:Uncharacterized protein n=1 Tax=Clostridium simiarum TaxID=2841506 RepID=A0ABS6EX76_9CLOT|nr:hypothetical protein [Clostridium simiarum]MBU5590725.1 hypothetical protein [Clostridium simiarum]
MNSLSFDVKNIEDDIELLEKAKIDILMLIDFPVWNRLTTAMENICKYYMAFIRSENELNMLEDMGDNKKEKDVRRFELTMDMDNIKKEIKPYLKDRDEILKDISEEKRKELQDIYLKISELELRKKQLMQLINMEYESNDY